MSTAHASATSDTVRAIGPTVSSVGQSGKTPSMAIAPHCGLRPTTSQQAAGSRIEPPVSLPSPSSQSPAASAAAFPLEDPPVVRPGRAGLETVPYHGFWPITDHANSGRLAFPITTAPAATSRSTQDAVRSGTSSP